MPLEKVVLQPSAIISGSVVTSDHFGANFLFDRDRVGKDTSPSGPSQTYDDAISALGVKTIRYPGGTVSERQFDLANPNSNQQNFIQNGSGSTGYDPDGTGGAISSTLGLSDALAYAAEENLSFSFVMPTIRFLGTQSDASGNRNEAVDRALVYQFTRQFLSEALQRGVVIDAIELGNEWWADNSDTFGTAMTAIEYGRIASALAQVIQNAINDFSATIGSSGEWEEPEILVQTGPGGNAEWVMPNGESILQGYSGPKVRSTELIFNQFDLQEEQRAVDGLVTHRYLTGSIAGVNGWAYSPFSTWDALASQNSNYGDLSRYVTEWNVAERNTQLHGLKQAGAIVSMFAEMIEAGVDHANIWAIQQNNNVSLSFNSGRAGANFEGLTVAGAIFQMMNESLQGMRSLSLPAAGSSLGVEGFGGSDGVVIFVSNITGQQQAAQIDFFKLAASYTHAWASILGVGADDPNSSNASPTLEILMGPQFMNGSIASFSLDAYETIRIVLTTANVGVSMAGGNADDYLNGSSHADIESGGRGNDTILGFFGNDEIYGGSGRDSLKGGLGNDTLVGGTGNDIYVFDGVDLLVEGSNAGRDLVRSAVNFTLPANFENLILVDLAAQNGFGNALDNRITGNDGNNTLDGVSGTDSLFGGRGNDIYITDGDDILFERAGQGTDHVLSSTSHSLQENIENLTLTGWVWSNATGNDLDNTILGNTGSNRIDGGLGSDILTGGSGSDIFVFSSELSSQNVDLITDFNPVLDSIHLSVEVFDGLDIGILLDASFSASQSGNALDALDRIIYETDTGFLYFDADGAGGIEKIQFSVVNSGLSLIAADFFVF